MPRAGSVVGVVFSGSIERRVRAARGRRPRAAAPSRGRRARYVSDAVRADDDAVQRALRHEPVRERAVDRVGAPHDVDAVADRVDRARQCGDPRVGCPFDGPRSPAERRPARATAATGTSSKSSTRRAGRRAPRIGCGSALVVLDELDRERGRRGAAWADAATLGTPRRPLVPPASADLARVKTSSRQAVRSLHASAGFRRAVPEPEQRVRGVERDVAAGRLDGGHRSGQVERQPARAAAPRRARRAGRRRRRRSCTTTRRPLHQRRRGSPAGRGRCRGRSAPAAQIAGCARPRRRGSSSEPAWKKPRTPGPRCSYGACSRRIATSASAGSSTDLAVRAATSGVDALDVEPQAAGQRQRSAGRPSPVGAAPSPRALGGERRRRGTSAAPDDGVPAASTST